MPSEREASTSRRRGPLHASTEQTVHQHAHVATGGHTLASVELVCAAGADVHHRCSRLSHGRRLAGAASTASPRRATEPESSATATVRRTGRRPGGTTAGLAAALILALCAQPLAAQPLGAMKPLGAMVNDETSEESCSDGENASSTLTPRPRRTDLRYVAFDTAGVTDAGSGRIARLARGILLPAEVSTPVRARARARARAKARAKARADP